MFEKRVTLLVGHFGSGKTEIALAGALGLAALQLPVSLVDLDIVKPYFRSRSLRDRLAAAGVQLIAPQGENIFADLPIIVPQVRGALGRQDHKLIFDVGGDDTGARVIGSLADVVPHADTDCLLVLNFNRPATANPAEAEAMVRRIEAVSRLPIAGLVSNTHLMEETTRQVVLDGHGMALETAERLGVPVVAVAVPADMADELDGTELDGNGLDCEIIRVERLLRPPFTLRSPEQRATGPLFVLT